ncbi:MAG: KilA-N domain-containing protein [Tannerella sp.]|jgi:hypothetical protein|nr:KilA-N domain-containing protein [Tannerella sp.]
MKTNQNMVRKMGQFDVVQRTSDGMFNATVLLNQWNKFSGQKKDVAHFFENTTTREFIKVIEEREFPDIGIPITAHKPLFPVPGIPGTGMETSRADNVIPITAQNKVFIRTKGGKDKGSTWMHPLLFIDFAMWLNPVFKYDVLKFVHDEMIKCRNEAGDEYKELGSAIKKIVPADFMQSAIKKVAEGINWVVFNNHETGIRNRFGDEQKQRELSRLEKKVSDLINEGFITEYTNVISYLRKMYQQKYYPKVFMQ